MLRCAQVAEEARRGHRILLSWNYRQLLAAWCRCWELVLYQSTEPFLQLPSLSTALFSSSVLHIPGYLINKWFTNILSLSMSQFLPLIVSFMHVYMSVCICVEDREQPWVFVCQYYIVFITMALSYNLKTGTILSRAFSPSGLLWLSGVFHMTIWSLAFFFLPCYRNFCVNAMPDFNGSRFLISPLSFQKMIINLLEEVPFCS